MSALAQNVFLVFLLLSSAAQGVTPVGLAVLSGEVQVKLPEGNKDKFWNYLEEYYHWENVNKDDIKIPVFEDIDISVAKNKKFNDYDYSLIDVPSIMFDFTASKVKMGKYIFATDLPSFPVMAVSLKEWASFLSPQIIKCKQERDTYEDKCQGLEKLLLLVIFEKKEEISRKPTDLPVITLKNAIFTVFADMTLTSNSGLFNSYPWVSGGDFIQIASLYGDSRVLDIAEKVFEEYFDDLRNSPTNLLKAIFAVKNFENGSEADMEKAKRLLNQIEANPLVSDFVKSRLH